MPTPYQPLSVRTGKRDPLPYHEGIPAHLRESLMRVVSSVLTEDPRLSVEMALELQIETSGMVVDSILVHCQTRGGDSFLDVLDYLLSVQEVNHANISGAPSMVRAIDHLLSRGMSVWGVVVESPRGGDLVAVPAVARQSGWGEMAVPQFRAGLRRRVPQTTEDAYLSALRLGGAAEGHLVTAWHAAYNPHPDKDTVWLSSVKAVEAALQPIVEPQNLKARLGSMRAKISDAPQKWDCQLPVWDKADTADPVAAFVQCLSRVTYQDGRHGADPAWITLEQARAVMIQAVAICEWIRAGVFRRVQQQETAGP